jgi:hypothetical protein
MNLKVYLKFSQLFSSRDLVHAIIRGVSENKEFKGECKNCGMECSVLEDDTEKEINEITGTKVHDCWSPKWEYIDSAIYPVQKEEGK